MRFPNETQLNVPVSGSDSKSRGGGVTAFTCYYVVCDSKRNCTDSTLLNFLMMLHYHVSSWTAQHDSCVPLALYTAEMIN